MSDDSSSREPSPRPFRPRSPGSDTDSDTSYTRHGTSSTFHPSSLVPTEKSPGSLLRQPVGFGAKHTPSPTRQQPTTSSSQHHYGAPAVESTPKHHSSKGKEKERSKDASQDKSRKGKERDKATATQPAVQQSFPPTPPAQPSPDAHKKKAFRIHAYKNDWNPNGAFNGPQEGPYGAAYRAEVAERVTNSGTQSTTPQSRQPASMTPDPDMQPRPSYYRHDYDKDKMRRPPPANRAQQAVAPFTTVATPTYTQPRPPHHSATPYQTSPPRPVYSSYRAAADTDGHRGSQTDTHTYTTSYPTPDPHYGETQDSYSNYYEPAQQYYSSPAPQSFHAPAPAPPPPSITTPKPVKDKRHKSRSHRHEQPQHSTPAPAPPAPAPPVSAPPVPAPPASVQQQPNPQHDPSVRVCRILTLLIEDKRGDEEENILAEVRVPLKPNGDGGFWADAQEITDELQKGASRIDGRAKVYTMRGKYKQYFLRISADGEQICQFANLKVSSERTLEIFVEDNPPPAGTVVIPPNPPPRVEREMLTPLTDSMISPSPAPMQLSSHRQTSKSSLFSDEDQLSPPADRHSFDSNERMPSVKKRRRSSSIQSIPPAQPGYHSRSPSIESFSPDPPPASARQSTAPSRTPSASYPSPQFHFRAPEPRRHISPLSPSPEPPPQRTDAHPQRVQRTESFTFPPVRRASPPVQAPPSSNSGPGPAKKTKLSISQPKSRAEHSVSPAPTQPGSYPWSHSRTSSNASETSLTGFAAYANVGMGASLNPYNKLPSANKYPSYLPKPPSSKPDSKVEAMDDSLRAPTTVAPSAISVTPTLSGQVISDLDKAVGRYIRSIIDKEPEWITFVENRMRALKMSEQLLQYKYVQGIIDRFMETATPADLEGAGGVVITKLQVMHAFNLPLSWGEECTETLRLTALYGPSGTRGADARVVKMLDDPPVVTTKFAVERYLALMAEVDEEWTMANGS